MREKEICPIPCPLCGVEVSGTSGIIRVTGWSCMYDHLFSHNGARVLDRRTGLVHDMAAWEALASPRSDGEYLAPGCPACAYDPIDERQSLYNWSSVYLLTQHFLHQYNIQDHAHLTYFLLR